MRLRGIFLFIATISLAACGSETEPTFCSADRQAAVAGSGLQMRTLAKGYGKAAEPGDMVSVHYTGWLYDEKAENGRGVKFDSSIDRGQQFPFQLGAGRVIRGWDDGVACMLIGEKRELIIPPEMGYGDRGAGGLIPPGATLVFEVELFAADAPDADR